MAPDQKPEASTEPSSSYTIVVVDGLRIAIVGTTTSAFLPADQTFEEIEPLEQYFENSLPTRWKLEARRYDRINADRKYLSEVARAKRHFGFKRPVRKTNRRRHER